MFAGVAELADAQASGACGSNVVWVQVPSPAVIIRTGKPLIWLSGPFFSLVFDRPFFIIRPLDLCIEYRPITS